MLQGLQPAISTAVMQILSALFESGLVEEVDITDVLRLFGIPPSEEHPKGVFSFNDPEWITAYFDFIGYEGEVIVLDSEGNELDPSIETDGTVMPPDRKLH